MGRVRVIVNLCENMYVCMRMFDDLERIAEESKLKTAVWEVLSDMEDELRRWGGCVIL